jgi:hypothetical protein
VIGITEGVERRTLGAKPGGFLLLITCCQGGSRGKFSTFWGAATLTGGKLPSKRELISPLDDAGFQDVQQFA